jgi:hypothetical protein
MLSLVELASLIRQLMARDPALRPPAKAILRLPFLRTHLQRVVDTCVRRGVPPPSMALECLGMGVPPRMDAALPSETRSSMLAQASSSLPQDAEPDVVLVVAARALAGGSPKAVKPHASRCHSADSRTKAGKVVVTRCMPLPASAADVKSVVYPDGGHARALRKGSASPSGASPVAASSTPRSPSIPRASPLAQDPSSRRHRSCSHDKLKEA